MPIGTQQSTCKIILYKILAIIRVNLLFAALNPRMMNHQRNLINS